MYHEHQFSPSTLKGRFKALHLHREPLLSWRATAEEINNALQKELDASGTNLKYFRIWAGLKKQKILVRKTLEKQSLELNPQGVQQRERRKLVREKYCNPDPN